MSELDEFRHAKDEFFAHHPDSPLAAEQKRSFEGLAYFPEDSAWVIEAELDTAVDAAEVYMATSTGTGQVYRRAGIARFHVDGQPAELTLYASDGEEELFLPFRDATSGKESYGAGRYLEVARPKERRVVVDFNHAYNPYCAYNDAWSCPLPPVENWLKVAVRAGEKSFPAKAYPS